MRALIERIENVSEAKDAGEFDVVVRMKSRDSANALVNALKAFGAKAGAGGDCEMFFGSDGRAEEKVGGIGHDVYFGDVKMLEAASKKSSSNRR